MKYVLVDYCDVWYNDEDGYWVNDIAITDIEIEINEGDEFCDIIYKLVDVGYLRWEIDILDSIIMEWNDGFIELFSLETAEPICRLEKI